MNTSARSMGFHHGPTSTFALENPHSLSIRYHWGTEKMRTS